MLAGNLLFPERSSVNLNTVIRGQNFCKDSNPCNKLLLLLKLRTLYHLHLISIPLVELSQVSLINRIGDCLFVFDITGNMSMGLQSEVVIGLHAPSENLLVFSSVTRTVSNAKLRM